MSFMQMFTEHITADYKLLGISTSEESRALREMGIAVNAMNKSPTKVHTRFLLGWSSIRGFYEVGGQKLPTQLEQFTAAVRDPVAALELIQKFNQKAVAVVFVLSELDNFFGNPIVVGHLQRAAEWGFQHHGCIVLLSSTLGIERYPRLAEHVAMLDFPLPDAAILQQLVRDMELDLNQQTIYPPISCSDELRERIVQALRGLTSREASDTLCRAIAKQREWGEHVLQVIRAEKAKIINSSEALSYVDLEQLANLELGGYDYLMNWCRQRREAYTKEARELFIDLPKGICLIGAPGCLDGETRLLYKRGHRRTGRSITMRALYGKFNKLPVKGKGHGSVWRDVGPTYLHSYHPETGEVFYNEIVSVLSSGTKKCVKVTLDSGEQSIMTPDHPVLTTAGFVKAEDLQPWSEVICRGHMLAEKAAGRKKRKKRITIEGLKYYAAGSVHNVVEQATGKVYAYKRQTRARLVLEAKLNSMTYDAFLYALKHDPEAVRLKTLPRDVEIHHENEDSLDDRADNLRLLSKPEHTRTHDPVKRFNVQYTRIQRVVALEDVGERETYDIQMVSPANNFALENGLFVHNTGKSVAAQAVAQLMQLPLFTLDVGALFGGLVGQSEANVRKALRQVTAQDGCVLLVDEIDKGLGNAHTASGDSGTTNRVFGTLLSWLANKQDRTFVFVTMNRTDNLPPELLRAGRWTCSA